MSASAISNLRVCAAGAVALWISATFAMAEDRFQILKLRERPMPDFSLSPDLTTTGRIDLRPVDRDGPQRDRNRGLLADFYPLGGGLRISGGAFGRLDLPTDMEPGSGAAGEVATRAPRDLSLSPLVTLGYGREFASGWSLSGDLGAVFEDTQARDGATLSGDSGFGADDGLSPFIRLGIGFRF